MTFPVTGTPPVYTAIMRDSTVLVNTTDTAIVTFSEEGNYTCVATSGHGYDLREFAVIFTGKASNHYFARGTKTCSKRKI